MATEAPVIPVAPVNPAHTVSVLFISRSRFLQLPCCPRYALVPLLLLFLSILVYPANTASATISGQSDSRCTGHTCYLIRLSRFNPVTPVAPVSPVAPVLPVNLSAGSCNPRCPTKPYNTSRHLFHQLPRSLHLFSVESGCASSCGPRIGSCSALPRSYLLAPVLPGQADTRCSCFTCYTDRGRRSLLPPAILHTNV